MADPERLDRLRLAQREIVARLDDPRTPPYSIAPLSNQLRLIERDIGRLVADEDVDHGLPDPELFGLVDALAYGRWLRGPHMPARRRPPGEFIARRDAIFASWRDAGFELTPRPSIDGMEEWVEANRKELARCLGLEEAEQ